MTPVDSNLSLYCRLDVAFTSLLYLEREFINEIESYFKKMIPDVSLVCTCIVKRVDDAVELHVNLNKTVDVFFVFSNESRIKNVDVFPAHDIAAKYDMLRRSRKVKDAVHIYDAVISKPVMIGDVLEMYNEYACRYAELSKRYDDILKMCENSQSNG